MYLKVTRKQKFATIFKPWVADQYTLTNVTFYSKSTKVTSSASSTTSTTNAATTTNNSNNNKSGKVVDILDQDGSEAPAALNLPLGNLYFGYKYVPPKSAQDAQATEVKVEPVFEGAGQTLRPPRKNARGSGTNSPAPSMASTGASSSRTPTPAPPAEPKPDLVPFQGKGNTMR